MNIVFYDGPSPFTIAYMLEYPGAVRDVGEKRAAWDNALKFLALSPRFRQMLKDITDTVSVTSTRGKEYKTAYVVDGRALAGAGKFWGPHETGSFFWPVALRGQPIVQIDMSRSFTIQHTGEERASFGGASAAFDDLYNGAWIAASKNRVFASFSAKGGAVPPAAGTHSPLITVAHELGHLWQWVMRNAEYERLEKAAILKGISDIKRNPFALRIELHNILNNESLIAYELGECVRFHYGFGQGFESLELLYSAEAHVKAERPALDNLGVPKQKSVAQVPDSRVVVAEKFAAAYDLRAQTADLYPLTFAPPNNREPAPVSGSPENAATLPAMRLTVPTVGKVLEHYARLFRRIGVRPKSVLTESCYRPMTNAEGFATTYMGARGNNDEATATRLEGFAIGKTRPFFIDLTEEQAGRKGGTVFVNTSFFGVTGRRRGDVEVNDGPNIHRHCHCFVHEICHAYSDHDDYCGFQDSNAFTADTSSGEFNAAEAFDEGSTEMFARLVRLSMLEDSTVTTADPPQWPELPVHSVGGTVAKRHMHPYDYFVAVVCALARKAGPDVFGQAYFRGDEGAIGDLKALTVNVALKFAIASLAQSSPSYLMPGDDQAAMDRVILELRKQLGGLSIPDWNATEDLPTLKELSDAIAAGTYVDPAVKVYKMLPFERLPQPYSMVGSGLGVGVKESIY